MALRKAKEVKGADDLQSGLAIPFKVSRSDGTEMPSEYSLYEKVEENAKPIIDWQNKLGQALAAELMPDATGHYFLKEFPTHYHLRWYQAKEEKKKAIHYYLFGYPEDVSGANKARKYYRSPNHFLPHLLWLIGDSEDKGDCACEFCSGSKPITSKSAISKPIAATGQGSSSAGGASATTSATTSGTTTGNSAAGGTKTTAVGTKGLQNATLFRAGEVVWYKNNNSWRVGMVLTSSMTLSIIPFSYPLYPAQEVVKEEADIRPFLAFSIPQINNALQEFKGRALSQIDWQALQFRLGVLAEPARREGLAIEATKLAASRVDQCYSIFDPIQSEPGYATYGGVFLGAEKICVGEAVRIHVPRDQRDQAVEKGMPLVMVIRRIIFVGNILGNDEGGTLVFEGSLWKLQHATLAQQQQTFGFPQLPMTMVGEKKFRDELLMNRGWCVEWALMNQNQTLNESDIRGRFYETQRLTPILNPARFQEMLRLQNVDDIQTLLNNRADSDGPRVGRVRDRAQAVMGAVPDEVLASLNLGLVEG